MAIHEEDADVGIGLLFLEWSWSVVFVIGIVDLIGEVLRPYLATVVIAVEVVALPKRRGRG
jgi:hypothetical protein